MKAKKWEGINCNISIIQYHPELVSTPKLEADNITIYQELISMVFSWAMEVVRVDILHEMLLQWQY